MGQIRFVWYLGRVQVSAWCTSHGYRQDHCLWSRSVEVGYMEPADILLVVAEATRDAARSADKDELEGCTSDCLR